MSSLLGSALTNARAANGRFLWLLLSVALLGALLLLTTMRWGVGLSPDSAVYIAAARNLSQGLGLTVPFGSEINAPLAHHAPLYPILLAGWGYAGIDPLSGARWLQALLFAANITLTGVLVWQLRPPHKVWGVIAAGLALVAPPLFTLHSMAWTEALFLLLGLSGLAWLARYLLRPGWLPLLLGAVCLGLALLTRYAGVALLATAVFALLLLSPQPWRSRLVPAALLGSVTAPPLLLWVLWHRGSGSTIRTLYFHPVQWAQLQQGLNTVAGWLLLPQEWTGLLKSAVWGILLLATGVAVSAHFRRQDSQQPWRQLFPPLFYLLALFLLIYPAFLLISISFFDANTPLDDRILAPVYLTLLILLVYVAALTQHGRLRWQQLPLWLLMASLALGYTWQSGQWLRQGYDQGIGFNSLAWQHSPLLQAVRQLNLSTPIYANAPEPINLHTGRPVLRLPRKFESVTQQVNSHYATEMSALRTQLAQEAGVVVYFTLLPIPALPTPSELTADLGLTILFSAEDGLLYGISR